MKLQLAENSLPAQVNTNYTFVPGANGQPGVWVRDDQFDQLGEDEYEAVMEELEPFQPQQLSQLSGIFGKKDKSQPSPRQQKKLARVERKKARTELVKAKAEGIKSGTFQPGTAIAGITGAVQDIAGQVFGGGSKEMAPADSAGGAAPDESKPFYKNPLVIGGGILLLAGGLYLATRKRKRK